jgi:hypothetical protein
VIAQGSLKHGDEMKRHVSEITALVASNMEVIAKRLTVLSLNI